MKLLFLSLCLSLSSTAFAISDAKLIKKCEPKGAQKLQSQARIKDCSIALNTLRVEDVDNRFGNPFKYVWYSVQAKCDGQEGVLETMVQYNSFSGKCL